MNGPVRGHEHFVASVRHLVAVSLVVGALPIACGGTDPSPTCASYFMLIRELDIAANEPSDSERLRISRPS
jgi:hypothetical protein